MLFINYVNYIKYFNFISNRFNPKKNKSVKLGNRDLNLSLAIIFYIICLLSQVSCSIYKMDVRQGMEMDDKQLSKLVPKLSKNQVQRILGEPNLEQLYSDRIDYYYLNKTNNHNTITKKHLTLYFNNKGELVYYDGNLQLKNLPRKLK